MIGMRSFKKKKAPTNLELKLEQMQKERDAIVPMIIQPDQRLVTANIVDKVRRLMKRKERSNEEEHLLSGLQKTNSALAATNKLEYEKNKQAAVLRYHKRIGVKIVDAFIGAPQFTERVREAFVAQYATIFALAKTEKDFYFMQSAIESATQQIVVDKISKQQYQQELQDMATLTTQLGMKKGEMFIVEQ